jgi:hypothetical protein
MCIRDRIIAVAINKLREETQRNTIAFNLMPKLFTLTELQKVYETILDTQLLTANFRRKISKYVTETDDYAQIAGHRPSKLYKRNLEEFIK